MTTKAACKCPVLVEEKLLNLNRFQLNTFQGDNIIQYYMVVNSVRPSGPCLSSVVIMKRFQSYVPCFLMFNIFRTPILEP